MTTIEQLHRKWLKDKKYRRDYETLEAEYSLSATLLSARVAAGLTQEQLAKRMKTTQSVIARLETGRAMPSTRTLQKLARATGTELRIVFEPSQSRGAQASVHTGR